jgi:hypothetical protein
MLRYDVRRIAPILALVVGTACAKPASDASTSDSAAAGSMSRNVRDSTSSVGNGTSTGRSANANASWRGTYALRGALDKSRTATGTLIVEPLDSIAPTYDSIRRLVRVTYPSYAGPFYTATLSLIAGADTLHSQFSCAHGPTTPPNIVCQPNAPLKGLGSPTLVVQPDGQAVLTGSHTEGVTVDYGRFTWTKA